MGDMIAHMTAGKMLRCRLAEQEPGLSLYMPAFFLGNMGPDIFYYSLLPGKKSLMGYGDRFQVDVDIASMFRIVEAEEATAGRHKQLLFSWYAGLISHYCADKYLHPYVESSVYERQKAGMGSNASLHGLCETEIDIALYHKQTGRPISTFTTDFLRLEAGEAQVIAEVWHKLIAALFHETVKLSQITNAIHTIPVLTFLQLHGTSLTKPIAKAASRFSSDGYDLSNKLKCDHPCAEILNEERKVWRDPRHPEGVYCHSVEDILVHAAEEAQGLISTVFHRGSAADSPLITRNFDFGYYGRLEEVLRIG